MKRLGRAGSLIALLGMLGGASISASRAEDPAGSVPGTPKICAEGAAEVSRGMVSLPATARALRERHKIRVLAVGATPLNERDQAQGQYAMVVA
ncbi:MAG: hypothetical protein JSS20_15555, partial [Proteobacteria bacterium]|nr:hypothetical protein [Pseudomonadota bacterium]